MIESEKRNVAKTKWFKYRGWNCEESFQASKLVKFSRVLPVKASSVIVPLRSFLMWSLLAVAVLMEAGSSAVLLSVPKR